MHYQRNRIRVTVKAAGALGGAHARSAPERLYCGTSVAPATSDADGTRMRQINITVHRVCVRWHSWHHNAKRCQYPDGQIVRVHLACMLMLPAKHGAFRMQSLSFAMAYNECLFVFVTHRKTALHLTVLH